MRITKKNDTSRFLVSTRNHKPQTSAFRELKRDETNNRANRSARRYPRATRARDTYHAETARAPLTGAITATDALLRASRPLKRAQVVQTQAIGVGVRGRRKPSPTHTRLLGRLHLHRIAANRDRLRRSERKLHHTNNHARNHASVIANASSHRTTRARIHSRRIVKPSNPKRHPIHPSIHPSIRATPTSPRARDRTHLARTKIRPSMRASRRVDTYRGHRRRESHHRGATWISASHSAARSTGPTKNDDDVTNARAQTAHTGVDLNAVRSRVVRGKIVYGRARACARVLKRGRGHRWGREGRFGFFGSDIRRVRVVPRRLHSASSFDDVIGRTRRVTIDRSIAVERVGFTDVEPFFFLFFHARCLRAVRAFGG